MYHHLVNEIYHTVMYTLLPIDYVHDSQSATRTDFVYIENRQILYKTFCNVHSNSHSTF